MCPYHAAYKYDVMFDINSTGSQETNERKTVAAVQSMKKTKILLSNV